MVSPIMMSFNTQSKPVYMTTSLKRAFGDYTEIYLLPRAFLSVFITTLNMIIARAVPTIGIIVRIVRISIQMFHLP